MENANVHMFLDMITGNKCKETYKEKFSEQVVDEVGTFPFNLIAVLKGHQSV